MFLLFDLDYSGVQGSIIKHLKCFKVQAIPPELGVIFRASFLLSLTVNLVFDVKGQSLAI